MRTTLLFIDANTFNSSRDSERNCVAVLENSTPTPEFILEVVRPTMKSETECRVGVLVVRNGKLKPKEPWLARRYAALDQIPEGAFFDLDPQTVRDIQDDAYVEITLPPFLAVFQQ